MKRITTITGLLFVLPFAAKSVATARPVAFFSQKAETFPRNAATIFDNVKSDLVSKTNVPLRLPSYFPDAGDVKNPIYANVQHADRKSYSIELGWAENCNGGMLATMEPFEEAVCLLSRTRERECRLNSAAEL